MTYYPPLKGDWKDISYFIVAVLCCILVIFAVQIFFQLKHDADMKSIDANGIVTNKKDLKAGDFSFVIKDGNTKKEFVLGGHRSFFDKFQIEDSMAKRPKSFLFDVFRKMDSSYHFVGTIGYE